MNNNLWMIVALSSRTGAAGELGIATIEHEVPAEYTEGTEESGHKFSVYPVYPVIQALA